MEGLGHIEVVPVTGSGHVRVHVLLVDPVSSVPELAVTLISRSQRVRSLVDLELGALLKGECVVSVSEVWLVVLLGVDEAGTCGGGVVVNWLMVWSSLQHGLCAVTSAVGVQTCVVLGDQGRVESNQDSIRKGHPLLLAKEEPPKGGSV